MQRLADMRGTLCSKLRDQRLVGMVARQDVRISGYEVGKKAGPDHGRLQYPHLRLDFISLAQGALERLQWVSV